MRNSNNQIALLRVLESGPANSKDMVHATGLSKRAVSVGIGRLVEAGDAVRGDNGIVTKKEKKA